MSFHALSCLIQVNPLHAEASYIIHIACHWIFFSITSFSYFFGSPKPRFISIFQLQIFSEPYLSNLCSPMSRLITGLKQLSAHIAALFGCRFKISSDLHYIPKSGLKTVKISIKSAMFWIQAEKQMQVKCACGFRNGIMMS